MKALAIGFLLVVSGQALAYENAERDCGYSHAAGTPEFASCVVRANELWGGPAKKRGFWRGLGAALGSLGGPAAGANDTPEEARTRSIIRQEVQRAQTRAWILRGAR